MLTIFCLAAYCKNSSTKQSVWPINRLLLTSQPITGWLAKQTKNYWLFSWAFILTAQSPVSHSVFPLFLFGKKHLQTPDIHLSHCSCTVLLNCYHLFHKQFWQLTSWPYTSKETTVEFNLLELPWIPLWFFFKRFHPEQKCRLISLMFILIFCQFISKEEEKNTTTPNRLPPFQASRGKPMQKLILYFNVHS